MELMIFITINNKKYIDLKITEERRNSSRKIHGNINFGISASLKSKSMINYLKYFCANSVHYPSLVKNSYQVSAFNITPLYICLPAHDNQPDCRRVEIAGAVLTARRGECFYTYFSPSIPSFVLCRGNSSRSSFVEITRIGFKSYRCVYNFLIPLLQITDCILKTHQW